MAKKGQKFNKYSKELKQEITNKYLNNEGTSHYLSKEYNIPLKTVKTWIYKINKQQDITNDNRGKSDGRKKEENIDYKERYEILKKYQAFLKAQRERK